MFHRKTLRAQSIDYKAPEIYFFTACLNGRPSLMAIIDLDGEKQLTDIGTMVSEVWLSLPIQYPDVELDAFVVMPDHFHGIFLTGQSESAESVSSYADVLRWFKSVTTARYSWGVRDHGWPRYDGKLWQRGSYDHVIRNDADLEEKRQYIESNPWIEANRRG